MQYLVLSFSHRNASLSLREKLSIGENEVDLLLEYILHSKIVKEAILLSTCNRLEILMIANDAYDAFQLCFTKLAELSQANKDELEDRADTFEGYSAIHHIFLVASSLDSLVVGETQISGQLKKSYRYSLHNSYCSSSGLGSVIDFAFKCASIVRNETGVSKKPISIASVAVSSTKKIDLHKKEAIVIGIGEMGELTIKHLLNLGFKVKLLNRNKQKAIDFKDSLNNDDLIVLDFSHLRDELNNTELLFSATASKMPIITNDMIDNVPYKRYFFDLALPRDIENLNDSNIKITTIDDLQNIVDENMNFRKDSLNRAYEIVGDEVNEFFKYLNILSVAPIIKTLRQIAKDASINEINKAIQKGFLPESYKSNIEKTIHNVFNVFLHTPTKNLKSVSSTSQLGEIERTLKMLFNISDDNLKEAEQKHDNNAKMMR